VNDPQLRAVYSAMLNNKLSPPPAFRVLSSNPSSFGPKRGLQILQLDTPFQISRLDAEVALENNRTTLVTRNVRRFRLWPTKLGTPSVVVDGQSFDLSSQSQDTLDFTRDTASGPWSLTDSGDTFQVTQRGPRNAVSSLDFGCFSGGAPTRY
jgi:hypothetical protein